jgi:hypothetical protein
LTVTVHSRKVWGHFYRSKISNLLPLAGAFMNTVLLYFWSWVLKETYRLEVWRRQFIVLLCVSANSEGLKTLLSCKRHEKPEDCILELIFDPESGQEFVQTEYIVTICQGPQRIIWCSTENWRVKHISVFIISSIVKTEDISFNKYVTKKIHAVFPAVYYRWNPQRPAFGSLNQGALQLEDQLLVL